MPRCAISNSIRRSSSTTAATRAARQRLIENFTTGRYFGVPLLQLYGMAVEPEHAAAIGVEPYPHMLRWLR